MVMTTIAMGSLTRIIQRAMKNATSQSFTAFAPTVYRNVSLGHSPASRSTIQLQRPVTGTTTTATIVLTRTRSQLARHASTKIVSPAKNRASNAALTVEFSVPRSLPRKKAISAITETTTAIPLSTISKARTATSRRWGYAPRARHSVTMAISPVSRRWSQDAKSRITEMMRTAMVRSMKSLSGSAGRQKVS